MSCTTILWSWLQTSLSMTPTSRHKSIVSAFFWMTRIFWSLLFDTSTQDFLRDINKIFLNDPWTASWSGSGCLRWLLWRRQQWQSSQYWNNSIFAADLQYFILWSSHRTETADYLNCWSWLQLNTMTIKWVYSVTTRVI